MLIACQDFGRSVSAVENRKIFCQQYCSKKGTLLNGKKKWSDDRECVGGPPRFKNQFIAAEFEYEQATFQTDCEHKWSHSEVILCIELRCDSRSGYYLTIAIKFVTLTARLLLLPSSVSLAEKKKKSVSVVLLAETVCVMSINLCPRCHSWLDKTWNSELVSVSKKS